MKARFAILAAIVGGCTSVHVAQRNDCWVRTTETWPNRVHEEVGPCARPPPAWSDDRMTRLVQECVAQSDFRWQNRALAAWSAGQPMPEKESEENVLQSCVAEATKTAISENEALEAKLAAMGDERERLRAHDDQITAALGEAAKKPAGSAVATASAEGKGDGSGNGNSSSQHESKSEESHSSEQASTSQPPMILQQPASQPIILQSPPPAAAPQPIVLQSPAPAAPQPIVLSQPAPQPYAMPVPQPIILNSQAPQMQPIVLNTPAPQIQPIYLNAPDATAKPKVKVVKRSSPPAQPKCPPKEDTKTDVASAKADKSDGACAEDATAPAKP